MESEYVNSTVNNEKCSFTQFGELIQRKRRIVEAIRQLHFQRGKGWNPNVHRSVFDGHCVAMERTHTIQYNRR